MSMMMMMIQYSDCLLYNMHRRRSTQVCVDPPPTTALTLPARCCTLAPTADMDRKVAAIDGTDRRTPNRYVYRAYTGYYKSPQRPTRTPQQPCKLYKHHTLLKTFQLIIICSQRVTVDSSSLASIRRLFGYNKWESVSALLLELGRLNVKHLIMLRKVKFHRNLLHSCNTVLSDVFFVFLLNNFRNDCVLQTIFYA